MEYDKPQRDEIISFSIKMRLSEIDDVTIVNSYSTILARGIHHTFNAHMALG